MRTALLLSVLAALVGCEPEYELVEPASDALPAPLTVDDDVAVDGRAMRDVDVLVVIDGSGSMQDDRERVSDGIVALRDDIHDRAENYSILFTTADPSEPGVVGPFGPDDSSADLEIAPFMLPMTGVEKPFGAIYNLVRSRAELFPAERDLLIFIVTDEDDRTYGLGVDQFKNWSDEQKGGDSRIEIVSIAPLDVECSGDVAERLLELADMQGNDVVDLCEPDWEQWLYQTSILTDLD